ncbi:mucin-5AC [Lucilia sericata]|uniref:mucin-5AC n=1 Tax=Lucilia sericata TaxID=13632 RepID=UPI0018A829D4|nr:mucin-5AC [Lucilia sericata]
MSEKNAEEFNTSNALVVISNEYTSTPIGLTKSASSAINDIQDDAPRIICNELIVNPHKSKSMEKLDELSSLEREIAKMHHVDEAQMDLDEVLLSSSTSAAQGENQTNKLQMAATLTSATDASDLSNGKNANNVVRCGENNLEDKLEAMTSGETALEHEDLIAVLKGLDGNGDDTHNNSGTVEEEADSILEKGVTIEGEGEYQIMEVIDDDSNANEDATKTDIGDTTSTSTTQNINKKTFGSTALTVQEERALALEQIECLKTVQRRRKQDIKPIKQIDPALELVSALEAEWSENDDELSVETTKKDTKTKLPTLKTKVSAASNTSKTIADNKANTPLITSVVVIPSTTATVSSTTPSSTATAAAASTTLTTPNVSSGTNNNATTTENIKPTKSSPVEGIINTKTEEDTQIVGTQTGFRRTRIIKRKIIWDPDAPETTFSYAKLVKSNNNTKTKTEPTIKVPITKGSTTITPLKKETLPTTTATTTASTTTTAKKTQRPTTPKVKKTATIVNTEKATATENTGDTKTTTVEKELIIKTNTKTEETETKASPSLETKSEVSPTSPAKRRSQTPVANISPSGSTGVKKRKNNELDRLMGDEGAVNMLNSLEKLEASLGPGEAKSTRPLMRSRAATICEKLPRKDTTPPARRAPTPTSANQPTTTKGKRATKPRASSSWDYVYKKKKQDFDDSLIIRRRSNSSYSSTTSLNRLSLDGPPASNSSTKSNDSKSLLNSSSENDLSKTPPATSSHNKSSGSSKTTRSTPTPPASSVKSSFEFAKPENKKSTQKRTKSPAATLTNDMKKAAPVASRRNARSPATTTNEDKGKEAVKTANTKSPTMAKDKKDASPSSSSSSSNTLSDVVVKKSSKVAQILFSTNKAKLSNTFTIQMLNKLVDILDKLASDQDCHVVVMGTNDAHFCQGIDLTDLTTIAAEKRKNYAVNLATSVKNYLKTLATYPKPLIAGVSGNLMNLGVIQLALFDVVIAGDKTTFETPYAKMGQAPEGYCIWHNMNKIRGSFKTKLFWLCERIQSTEAALAGLVNKLTAANKVNDDAFATARRIASLSSETYRAMKKTAINSHLDVIVSSLDEEFDTIIKQWTSSDCLDSLKKFLVHD